MLGSIHISNVPQLGNPFEKYSRLTIDIDGYDYVPITTYANKNKIQDEGFKIDLLLCINHYYLMNNLFRFIESSLKKGKYI